MKINIISAGCCFPTGPELALADIAFRTEFSLNYKHPFYLDFCGIPVKCCYFRGQGLDFDICRWLWLVQAAWKDSLKYNHSMLSFPCRLWIILPPNDRPGIFGNLPQEISDYFTSEINSNMDIKFINGEQAAAGEALAEIMRLQEYDEFDHIDIICSVDSFIMPECLLWLEEHKRIHNSHYFFQNKIHTNPYGCIPSEAASIIVLTRNSSFPIWCQLSGIGIAEEYALPGSEIPCTGVGLAKSARNALDMAEVWNIKSVTTDYNGEPWRADEYGFVILKLDDMLNKNFIRHTPVLASGEIGCASLVTHIALQSWNLMKCKSPLKDNHLIFSSSNGNNRSSVILSGIYDFN